MHIQEDDSEEIEASEESLEEESRYRGAIEKVFDERLERSKVAPLVRKEEEDEESEEPSIPPEKYSEREVEVEESFQSLPN